MGSASVNLLGGLPSAPAIPDNAMTFTVNVEDVSLNLEQTVLKITVYIIALCHMIVCSAGVNSNLFCVGGNS